MVNESKVKFGKIVYLDEQAIVDFLEQEKSGSESTTIKKISETMANIGTEASINKNFFSLIKLKLSGNASHQKNNIIETQIASTLTSSFINEMEKSELIQEITNSKLIISKNSAAYYRNLVPVLHMIDDINKINTLSDEDRENFNGINLKGVETTLDALSGYYDFLCICSDGNKKIVRFNISGLRNNYTLNDLTKMNLKLFGVKVGESSDTNLDFSYQIDKMTQEETMQDTGLDFDEENALAKSTYDVIDIILAGI
ncbi:hypothetical protein FDF31_03645 [Clostridium sporogenes]|jgi:hypothetical protein|uniref:DUF6414 family protein n=1 Tax=unclassified Clostridium TaxID=2614128 RepID=UPI0013D21A3B|nr:hypothetical protein [Clostridium sporogenes]NFS24769.1 hypothetical protein [Clostridium sporogenes]